MTEQSRLQVLRTEVDRIDLQIVDLLAARQRLVKVVAGVKGDPRRVRDREREQAILARVGEAALMAGLSPAIALPVWGRLLEVSVKYEREILARSDDRRPEAACCGCRHPDE